MITKEQKIRLGVFLFISTVLLAGIIAVLMIPRMQAEGDVYFIDFQDMSVNGVNEGADVKYQGVKIGKVTRIDVNPKNLRSILVFVELKKGFPMKTDMRATLQYAGITGLRFVEITGGRKEAKTMKPGEKILTKKGLGEKAEDIVLNIDSVVEAVNDMLKQENREKFSNLLTNLEKSTTVLSNLMEKRQRSLGNAVQNIEKITVQLQDINSNLNNFLVYLNDATKKVKLEKLEKIVGEADTLIKNLGQRFSKEEFGKLMGDVDTFFDGANTTMKKVENRFLDLEDEMSRTLISLRESINNVARFTRDLREDPTLLIRKRSKAKRRRK